MDINLLVCVSPNLLTNVSDFINLYRINLNKTLCKYGITTPARMAAFFAQTIVETSWFTSQTEIDAEHKHYAPWYGRGFLQLTNSEGSKNIEDSNYYNYFRWRGKIPAQASPEQIDQWRKNVAQDSDDAAQSAGFYWIAPQFGPGSGHNAERPSWYADTYAPNIRVAAGSHAYYSNESARRVAAYVNIPGAVYGHYNIYGLPERYSCYANALVVLDDTPVFPSAEKGKPSTDVPENFVLRQPW